MGFLIFTFKTKQNKILTHGSKSLKAKIDEVLEKPRKEKNKKGKVSIIDTKNM